MKIVSIEGLDKSGKHTATNILSNYFEEYDMKVARMSYPNYDSPVGELIHRWLRGTFDADVKTFEFLQAADKQHAQTLIQAHEDNGVDILIMDRYKHSQLAYGSYDNDPVWMRELTKYMRDPDVVLYLDVEPEVSMGRRGEHGDNDIYENDIKRLRDTRDNYKAIFKQPDAVPVMWVNANTPKLVVRAQLFQIADRLRAEFTGEMVFDEGLDGYSGDFTKVRETLNGNEKLEDPVGLGFDELPEADMSEILEYADDLGEVALKVPDFDHSIETYRHKKISL